MKAAQQRFEATVSPHFEALHRAALRLTRRRADAEDLVQDVCMRAFTKLAELEAADRPLAWLLRVQYRLFVDGARRRRRSPVRSLPGGVEPDIWAASDAPGPDAVAAGRDGGRALERAWAQLEEPQRALLALHAEGYSLGEIAHIAGISNNAVSARLHRARARLGRLLKHAAGGCMAATRAEEVGT